MIYNDYQFVLDVIETIPMVIGTIQVNILGQNQLSFFVPLIRLFYK